ncbi:uncharacterized protein RJT20DRAFT_1663 [Scheffersomyces xylosifermentans]|uniref:uncharacterized protein n=1 Tax=Scheffersomyces xylosifermentans TaxID=1304137 RepID=UPI00315C5A86
MSTIVSRKPSMLPHSSRITSSTQSPSTNKTITTNNSLQDHFDNNKVIVSSFLFKRSSKTHQWKKKWVVLRNCQLSYYKDSTEYKPNKVISSSNLQSFSKIPDHQRYHFAIYTNNKVLHFKTGDKTIYKKWIVALETFFKEDDEEATSKEETSIVEETIKVQKIVQPEISHEVSHNSGLTQEQSELAEDGSLDENAEADVDNAGDEAEEDDQASSSKSQNLVSVSSSSFHHSYNINSSRHSLPVSVKRTNSYTDEYSGPEDPYLSSGVSDSQMNQDSPTFAPSPFVLENPIKEEVEEEDRIDLHPPSVEVSKKVDEVTTPMKELDISEPVEINHEARISQKRTSIRSLPDVHEEECLIERGYLLRLRKRYNQWKRFYIVLTNKNMYFYKSESIHQVYKVIPISQLVDVIELDPLSKSKQWCLLIITPLKRVRFSAPSEEEMIKWLSALKALVMKRNMSKRK